MRFFSLYITALYISILSFTLSTIIHSDNALSAPYIYQSSSSESWRFTGCYLPDLTFSRSEIVIRGDFSVGSLYDCCLWGSTHNFTIIGMFNKGCCWGAALETRVSPDLPDNYNTLMSGTRVDNYNDSYFAAYPSANSSSIDFVLIGKQIYRDHNNINGDFQFPNSRELGGGSRDHWISCVYILQDLERENSINKTDRLNTEPLIQLPPKKLYDSSFDKLKAAIYSREARDHLFKYYFTDSDLISNRCQTVFTAEFFEAPVVWPPPSITEVTNEFLYMSSLHNRFGVMNYYQREDSWNSSAFVEWDNKILASHHKKNYCFGTRVCQYCSLNCETLFDKYGPYLRDKVGVVIGSSSPWLESSLLDAGVAHVITVEYRSILTRITRLTALLPSQLASLVRSGTWMQVDTAFSFSSIEHSGLGRYGDPLHAHGDFLSMEQITCLLKPGGLLFLTVPVGFDMLVYNAHRIYGRHRLPLLLRGWDVVDVIGEFELDYETLRSDSYTEPIIVLRKPFSA